MMKSPFLVFSCSAALALLPLGAVSAQTATPAASPAAKKASPLSSSEKQLVKNAAESMLELIHLGEIFRGQTPPGPEPMQKSGLKMLSDLNTGWGELATVAQPRGAELPKTDTTASEKKDLGEIRKAKPEVFEKTYWKTFTKSSKRATTVFTNGAKSNDAELKAFFEKWQPKIAKYNEEAVAAEAEASKKK